MREYINIMEAENASLEYDMEHVLYHGTDAEFSKFDRQYYRSGHHIYTSPDPRTAAFYGPNIYLCYARKDDRRVDLIDDHRTLIEVAKAFASECYDHVRDDEELNAVKQSVIQSLVDGGADEFDAEYDAEEDPRFIEARERAAAQHLYHIISNGNLYEFDHNGRFQADVLNYFFEKGYTSVMFTDYSSQGSPISVVFDNSDDVLMGQMLSKDQVEELPYYEY